MNATKLISVAIKQRPYRVALNPHIVKPNACYNLAMTTAVNDSSVPWPNVFATAVRLLTFRATREDLTGLSYRHLFLGLFCTWIVGMGRYYDNPRVGLLQHLGIGSVIYVFAFALFLWLLVWPLKLPHWNYLRVCTFVSLVAPPAIIYAIPVEQFFDIDTANSFNVLFLLIVACWRVALLIYFLRVLTRLDAFSIIVTTLLPLTVIITVLTALNLERAVFSIMGGLSERTANDEAFGLLSLLSLFSFLLFIPLLICYLYLVAIEIGERRRARRLKIGAD